MSATAKQLSVICGHPEGTLPTAWFRTYKQLKRKLKRTGLNARVAMAPLSELPAGIDVLILPPTLADSARFAESASILLRGTPDELQRQLDALVVQLQAEGRIEYAQADARSFATHVGFRAVGERARLEE